MAVVQADIKADLEALYTTARTTEMDSSDFADELATIIRDAILSADVTVSTPNVAAGGATRPGTGSLL